MHPMRDGTAAGQVMAVTTADGKVWFGNGGVGGTGRPRPAWPRAPRRGLTKALGLPAQDRLGAWKRPISRCWSPGKVSLTQVTGCPGRAMCAAPAQGRRRRALQTPAGCRARSSSALTASIWCSASVHGASISSHEPGAVSMKASLRASGTASPSD